MADFSVDVLYNSSFGSNGSGDGQFSFPSGITVLNNEIFIVDKQNHRIQVFDLDGVYLRKFGTNGSGNDNFLFPECITNDGTDLYITDSANHRIKKHQVNGTFLSEFGSEGTGNSNFKYPVGITYNNNNLYIVDKQNHRIKTHTIAGTFLFEFGSYGSSDHQFKFPEGIAVVNNNLIIADSGNEDVKTFNLTGFFIVKVSDTVFNYPTGIINIIDEDGVFAVVDRQDQKILFFNGSSNFIDSYGTVGSGDDEFYFPLMGFCHDETLIIVDSGNHRIKISDITVTYNTLIFKDQLVKLSKQLYPTGRAWWLNYQNIFSKFHEGLSLSESRALKANVDILSSILPDNNDFTEEDAFNWERALGLYINTNLTLEERKASILRKMQHPGDIPARQHYLYLQGQLRSAGFDVYVHENRFDAGGGNYEVYNPIASLYGDIYYGASVYDNPDALEYTKIANYVDELKDESFNFGDNINLRFTFFIGGEVFGTRANVDEERKNEFRLLMLNIKPVQTAGFLLIDYI